MKVRTLRKNKSRRKTPSIERRQVYTLSEAKTYLGRLAEKALQGQTVYIVREQQRFILQHVPEIEPIPMRPPGYFAYSKEEVEFEKQLGEQLVGEPPKDLE